MDNELWRWIWVATAMVMSLGEIFSAGFFLLPFGIGASLAAVAAWLNLHGAVQWLLFFGGTAASMLVLRRFMGRQDRHDDLPVGANRYVGMSARVIETIDSVTNSGRVRVESDEWRAVSETGHIEEGSLVRIIELHGTKLQVELLESPPDDYVPIARHSDAFPAGSPADGSGDVGGAAAGSAPDADSDGRGAGDSDDPSDAAHQELPAGPAGTEPRST